jgi:hypothetical protein
MGGAGGQNN